MLYFWNWKVKRSGAAMRVYGIAMREGVLHQEYKLSNVGDVTVVSGKVVAIDRDSGLIVATLSTVQFRQDNGRRVTYEEASAAVRKEMV